jgi:cytoskeletal protein CcmA (bactofilin family)
MKQPNLTLRPRTTLILIFACVGLLWVAADSNASVFRSGDNLHISKLHSIDDDFYATGENLRVDGTIDGDLAAFVYYQTTIQGTIANTATIFTYSLDCSGHIQGSARVFAETITLNGKIDRSLIAMGANISLRPGSVVERDVTAFGAEIRLDGMVNGNAKLEGGRVFFTGTVNGDVDVSCEEFIISPPAVITGDLTYKTAEEIDFDTTSGITIVGDIEWRDPREEDTGEDSGALAGISLRISSLLAAFLFGIIVVRLFRPYADESFTQLKSRISVSLAAGFLGILILCACVIVFVLALGTAVTGLILIGRDLVVPGSLLLIASTLLLPITSFASVSGGVILYSSKIIVAFVLGYWIMNLIGVKSVRRLGAASLIIGLTLLTLVFAIPYLGTILLFVVMLVGSGSIYLGIRHCRKDTPATANPPT